MNENEEEFDFYEFEENPSQLTGELQWTSVTENNYNYYNTFN